MTRFESGFLGIGSDRFAKSAAICKTVSKV